jgi:hypothetical protein
MLAARRVQPMLSMRETGESMHEIGMVIAKIVQAHAIHFKGGESYNHIWIFRRIRGYCTIMCALTRAFQWALVRPLEVKIR